MCAAIREIHPSQHIFYSIRRQIRQLVTQQAVRDGRTGHMKKQFEVLETNLRLFGELWLVEKVSLCQRGAARTGSVKGHGAVRWLLCQDPKSLIR